MARSIQRIFMLMMLVTVLACGRNQTEIHGLVSGGADTKLTLERLDVNRTSVVDSVSINGDGSFSFKTRLEEPELFVLKNQAGDIVNLLLSPGELIYIETSYDSFGSSYIVDGSEDSEGIRKLVLHLKGTRKDLDSLILVADSIGNPESPQLDLIRSEYSQAIIKQKRYNIRYLVENMSSLSSVYALYQKYDDEIFILGSELDLQYFKSVADSLEKVHPNSSLTKSLRMDIDRKEALYKEGIQMDALLSMADDEASGLLDLSIPDREGDSIVLSELKGKVVLVTFWASQNNASVQSLLGLKSVYNKYHARGFEIYAISLDNNKFNWMNAIDYNEFDWINVSELSYPQSRANVLYNVNALPSTFIINREGDIVAKNLYGRALETWLDNLI